MAKQTKTRGTASSGKKKENGAAVSVAAEVPGANAAAEPSADQIDPEAAQKIAALRAQVRENFGKVIMTMSVLPRYRHQTLGDLQHLVLEPLIRDRIAIAYQRDKDRNALSDVVGFAIWASVSEDVNAEIRQQIKAGVFPIRLKADAWNSGSINWLLDVIAPNRKLTAAVISSLKQVVKEGRLRLHPLVTRLVNPGTLEKMGAEKIGAAKPGAPT